MWLKIVAEIIAQIHIVSVSQNKNVSKSFNTENMSELDRENNF